MRGFDHVPPSANKSRLLTAWIVSVLISVLLLITVVLPAEYEIDPLGTGSLLGLTGLSSEQTTLLPLHNEAADLARHTYEIGLEPFQSVEIKYKLAADELMAYSWQSSAGEVLYELHSHPLNAAPGYADSAERQKREGRSGYYQAAYDGLHGWFWENRLDVFTTVKINVSGFFDEVYLYSDGVKEPLSFER